MYGSTVFWDDNIKKCIIQFTKDKSGNNTPKTCNYRGTASDYRELLSNDECRATRSSKTDPGDMTQRDNIGQQKCSGIGKCYFQCKKGYKPYIGGSEVGKTNQFIQCGGKGDNVFTKAECRADNCNLNNKINKIKDGSFSCSGSVRHGTKCNVTCKTGYRIVNKDYQGYKCGVNDKGENMMIPEKGDAICKPFLCDKPDDTTGYDNLPPKIYNLNDKVNVECDGDHVYSKDSQYLHKGKPYIKCDGKGKWDLKNTPRKWINDKYILKGCTVGECSINDKNSKNNKNNIGDKNVECKSEYEAFKPRNKCLKTTNDKKIRDCTGSQKWWNTDLNKCLVKTADDINNCKGGKWWNTSLEKCFVITNDNNKKACLNKANTYWDDKMIPYENPSKFVSKECVKKDAKSGIIKDDSHKCKEAACYLKKLVYLNNYEKDAVRNIDIKKCKSGILYHNSNCEVSCNSNYGVSKKDQPPYIRCEKGKVRVLNKCIQKKCTIDNISVKSGNVDTNNCNIINNKIYSGQTCPIKCNPGFVLDDTSPTRFKCNNGRIENLPKCKPVNCNGLKYTLKHPDKDVIGKCPASTVGADCNVIPCSNGKDGKQYTRIFNKKDIGNQTIKFKCVGKPNGKSEWMYGKSQINNGEELKCVRKSCFSPKQKIVNTIPLNNYLKNKQAGEKRMGYQYNKGETICSGFGKCYFRCGKGYSPYINDKPTTGVQFIKCGDGKAFTKGECKPNNCNLDHKINKIIVDGSFSCSGSVSHGRQCDVRCTTGYRLKNKGDEGYKCGVNKGKNMMIPKNGNAICEPIMCDKPDDTTGYVNLSSTLNRGAKVNVGCSGTHIHDSSKLYKGNPYIECVGNGKWDSKNNKWNHKYSMNGCKVAKCGGMSINSTKNITCSVGGGVKVLKCDKLTAKKAGLIETKKCNIAKCNLNSNINTIKDRSGVIRGQFINCEGAYNGLLNYGKECKVTCNPGYKVNVPRNELYKCGAGAKMVHKNQRVECIAKKCTGIHSKINEIINKEGNGNCGDVLDHDKTCIPKCKPGYTIIGDLKCDMVKNKITVPKCEINSCNGPKGNFKNLILKVGNGNRVICSGKKHGDICKTDVCTGNNTINGIMNKKSIEYRCVAGTKTVSWVPNSSGLETINITKGTKNNITKNLTCKFASCSRKGGKGGFTVTNTVNIPGNVRFKKASIIGDTKLTRKFQGNTTSCDGNGVCLFKCAKGYKPFIDGKAPDKQFLKNLSVPSTENKSSYGYTSCSPDTFKSGSCKKPECKNIPNDTVMGAKCVHASKGVRPLTTNEKCTMACDTNYYKANRKGYTCIDTKLKPDDGKKLICEDIDCKVPKTLPKGSQIIYKKLTKKGYRIDLQCGDGYQWPTKPYNEKLSVKKLCPDKGCPGYKCKLSTDKIANIKDCVSCPNKKLPPFHRDWKCGLRYWDHRETGRNVKVPKYIYVKARLNDIANTKEILKKEYMKTLKNNNGEGTKWNPKDIYDGIYVLKKGTGTYINKKWKPPEYDRIPNFLEELCGNNNSVKEAKATITFNHIGRGINGPKDHSGRWELTVESDKIEKQWLRTSPGDTDNYEKKVWKIVRYPESTDKISDISPLNNTELDNKTNLSNNLTKPKKWIMNTLVNKIPGDIQRDHNISTNHETEIIMVSIDTEDTLKKIKQYKKCYGRPKEKLLII